MFSALHRFHRRRPARACDFIRQEHVRRKVDYEGMSSPREKLDFRIHRDHGQRFNGSAHSPGFGRVMRRGGITRAFPARLGPAAIERTAYEISCPLGVKQYEADLLKTPAVRREVGPVPISTAYTPSLFMTETEWV